MHNAALDIIVLIAILKPANTVTLTLEMALFSHLLTSTVV